MSIKSDLVLPVLTGMIAIMLERAVYNRSSTLRALVGAPPVDR